MERFAYCNQCGSNIFIISDQKVVCVNCQTIFPFQFICEGICETKADELVKMITE